MSSSEGVSRPLLLQSPAMAPNARLAQQTTQVGLTIWPSIKYDGFFTFRQAWPSGTIQPEKPPPTANIKEAELQSPMRESRPSPDVIETNEAAENRVSAPAAEPQCSKTSDPETPAAKFTTHEQLVISGSQEFRGFDPKINNAADIPPPKFSPVITKAGTTSSTPTHDAPACQVNSETGPVAEAKTPESPYSKMNVYNNRSEGECSRELAQSLECSAGWGDRIVMFTDASFRPKTRLLGTAGVTYRRSYDGASNQSAPWIDLSYGAIGVMNANEAEIVAMAAALEALEHEVRSYAEAKENEPGSAPQLRVLIFSDSDVCLFRLFYMIKTLRKNKPYTGRDWTVEYLKAQVKKLGEFIGSTNMELGIEFRWVKGHSGVEGNERADRLATATFLTACSYFSAHDLASYRGKSEIVEMKEMSRILGNKTPDPLVPAPLADKPSSTTGTIGQLESETDEHPATMADTELATGSSGPTFDAAVLREIENVRQDIRGQRKEERRRSKEERRRNKKMTSELLEAAEERMVSRLLEEVKKISLVSAMPADGHAVVDSGSKPKKQRKRDVLVAKLRRAGERLRGRKRNCNS